MARKAQELKYDKEDNILDFRKMSQKEARERFELAKVAEGVTYTQIWEDERMAVAVFGDKMSIVWNW